MVNMGHIAVSRNAGDVLTALGLGSCIAVCAYDAVARAGGMIHVVLPDSAISRGVASQPPRGHDDSPAKFADQGVPRLIEDMQSQGGLRSRLRIAILGGANVLTSANHSGALDVGHRNIDAVRAALQQHGLSVVVEDVGGKVSRTVRLKIGDGEVTMKTIRNGEVTLASLWSARAQR